MDRGMDNISASAKLTMKTVEEIKREPSDLENTLNVKIPSDVESSSSELKPESPSDEKNVDDRNSETNQQTQPPQSTQMSLKPLPASSIRSLDSQRSTSSRGWQRWDVLSMPKCYCLKDTIEQFETVLNPSRVNNLRKQLQNNKIIREVTEAKHLECCTRPPTPQPPSGRRQPTDLRKQEQIMQKFNAKLKREAFDHLMDKIFTMLPRLVLEADITGMSLLPPSTQEMVNVIFSTLISYTGKPLTIHDHELYLHSAVGLARFFEDVIESVRRKVYSSESISGKKGNQRQGRCSMATATLEKFTEDLDMIQRSREMLKSMYSIEHSLAKESVDQ